MNIATYGKYRDEKGGNGYDELVTCDRCGWTWWVHVSA